jgi:hypothetical protein
MRAFASFASVLLLWVAAIGGTLDDYRAFVSDARTDIGSLIVMVQNDELPSSIEAFERNVVNRLRNPPPNLRRIEHRGSSVETDFSWLIAKFDRIGESPHRRLEILFDAEDRLKAIELELDDLAAATASDRSKDDDKRKLEEILRRVEFQKPDPPAESLIERILKAIDRWLAENFPDTNVPGAKPEGLQSASVVMQVVLYAVIIGLVGFLLYRFAPFLAAKLRRSERDEIEDRVILGETIAGSENATTLFSEAERLAREGNLRDAIRKGYIALLCELSDRKLIGLARYKTNRDYLRDVSRHGQVHRSMNGLTHSFERHWYGLEKVDDEHWEEFREGYRRTVDATRG